MRFAITTVVHRPLVDVLELLSDPDHVRRWQPDLVALTRLDGEPGRVGSTARLDYDTDGRRFSLVETVVAREASGRTVCSYTTTGMAHTIDTRLDAVDTATTAVVTDHEIRLSGVGRLMMPVLARSLRTQAQQRLDDLRSSLEAGATPGEPRP